MGNSILIFFKKPLNEMIYEILLCFNSNINLKSYTLSNRKFSVHEQMQLTCPIPYQCLQDSCITVATLLDGPRTTSSRRTRPQMNSSDKWVWGIWTTPSGDVQKIWRCKDLPSESTPRIQVKLHHVLSFFHTSMSQLSSGESTVSAKFRHSQFWHISLRKKFTDAVIPHSFLSTSMF